MGKKSQSSLSVLVCQCGSTEFDEDKATRTSVAMRCSRCGLPVSVKGTVVTLETAQKTARRVTETGERIEPVQFRSQVLDSAGRLQDKGYRSFRFRVSVEQDSTIQRAMEAVRVLNLGDPTFKQQDWQGAAVEAMAADFLSGVDPRVLSIIDAANEALERERARVQRVERQQLSPRRAREFRTRIRQRLIERHMGPGGTKDVEDVDGVPDRGRLFRFVQAALRKYANEIKEKVECAFRKKGSLQECIKIWERYGGFLFAVYGDERTVDNEGGRPYIYLWTEMDESVDLLSYYRTAMLEGSDPVFNASLEVVEIVTSDVEVTWDIPSMATRRETVESDTD